MGKVAGAVDLLEARGGYFLGEQSGDGRCHDAIVSAAQQQGGRGDAMQAAAELGIVHEGLPDETGEGFAGTYAIGDGGLGQLGEIDLEACGVRERELHQVGFCVSEQIDVIARVAVAGLDAHGTDQDEAGDALAGFDRHLCGDIRTERGGDDRHIFRGFVVGEDVLDQIEVEIGEVVGGGEVIAGVVLAEARVHRRGYASELGEIGRECRVRCQPNASGEKQDVAAGARDREFQGLPQKLHCRLRRL